MSLVVRRPQSNEGPNLVSVKEAQNRSELFRAEITRLIRESEKACKRLQEDENQRLDQRVRDIKFLKTELQLKLEEMMLEIDELVALQSRVVKAAGSCSEPLRVTLFCLDERKKRFPPDLLTDAVDGELLKEKELIEGVTSLLQHITEQITEQIRLNRSMKHRLEQDLAEKSQAHGIDDSCTLMTKLSLHDALKASSSKSLSSGLTPKQWEEISEQNMAKAEQQKTNSQSLRVLVQSLLGQAASDLQHQVETTGAAFQQNVQEIKNSKGKMEEQLTKIRFEFSSQQKMRDDIQVAIAENNQFLKVAQKRLAERHQRPGKERCRDRAQLQLHREVQQLTAHVDKLKEAVVQSEEEQRALTRCQLDLEQNIKIKSNSLYIDEVTCLQQRESVVIHDF
ncbi:tektin-1 [Synchiropus splendidus]|uniref:tektin-1 n=1 Tax=Synchiropus splendidus TaxID=270530 RepID=UPI00237DBD05|nr:tektin-1 [Synchiropus splendidus]